MPVSVCQAKMTAKKEDFTIIFFEKKVFSRQSHGRSEGRELATVFVPRSRARSILSSLK